MRALVAACLLALCGCGGAIAADTHTATATAVDTATDPESMAKWDALASSAAGAARDKLLDDETTQRVQAMVQALGQTLRAELVTTQSQVLDVQLREEVAQLRADLGAAARDIVRQAIDEALSETTLSELDAARERLVGAALREDLDAFLAKAGPGFGQAAQQAIAPVQAKADALGTKIEHYGIGFGAAFALFLIVHLVDRARQRRRSEARFAALEKRLAPPEVP